MSGEAYIPRDERHYANTTCPHCGFALDPLPRGKKNCPACRQAIYVRTAPDFQLHLLRADQVEELENSWIEVMVARADSEGAAVRETEAATRAAHNESVTRAQAQRHGRVQIAMSSGSCAACGLIQLVDFPIDLAPALPLSACTNDMCECEYIAHDPLPWDRREGLVLDALSIQSEPVTSVEIERFTGLEPTVVHECIELLVSDGMIEAKVHGDGYADIVLKSRAQRELGRPVAGGFSTFIRLLEQRLAQDHESDDSIRRLRDAVIALGPGQVDPLFELVYPVPPQE